MSDVAPSVESSSRARARRLLLAAALVSGLIFAALATTAARGELESWDTDGFAALYSGEASHAPGGATGTSSPIVHRAVALGNRVGGWEVLLVVVAGFSIVLAVRGRRDLAVVVVVGSAVAVLVPVLKDAFGRLSPFAEPGAYGFPSGHAMGPMAVAASCVVVLWHTSWRLPALIAGTIAVAAIGVAAISDGGHWPSDVVGGWALALAWVLVVAWAYVTWRWRGTMRDA